MRTRGRGASGLAPPGQSLLGRGPYDESTNHSPAHRRQHRHLSSLDHQKTRSRLASSSPVRLLPARCLPCAPDLPSCIHSCLPSRHPGWRGAQARGPRCQACQGMYLEMRGLLTTTRHLRYPVAPVLSQTSGHVHTLAVWPRGFLNNRPNLYHHRERSKICIFEYQEEFLQLQLNYCPHLLLPGSTTAPLSTSTSSSTLFPAYSTRNQVFKLPLLVSSSKARTRRWNRFPPYEQYPPNPLQPP